MSGPLDPYRTLGVQPGASADEIRRAYRRLAKAHHPDSAGEAALPRFLAIQAAYEMLVEGRTRGSAARGGAKTGGAGAQQQQQAGPWQADPGRARATRSAYTRRQRSTRPPDDAGAGSPGASPGASTGRGPRTSGGRDTAGGSDTAGTRGMSGGSKRAGGRTRAPNKATLGSTSYDAAEDEPFEPDWSGGGWYGASSGTYWTINPKEYADPRKHGPEYQRRARRAIDDPDDEQADGETEFSSQDFADTESETDAGGVDRQGFDGRWTYPDETVDQADWDGDVDESWARRPPPSDDIGPRLQELIDRLIDGRIGFYPRFVVAFLGTAPIAAIVAWLVGEVSGCGRFTASCADSSVFWSTLPLLGVYALLVAVPTIAGISAVGLAASLVVGGAVAVFLSASGGSRMPEESTAILNAAVVGGYAVGVVMATVRRTGWRRVP